MTASAGSPVYVFNQSRHQAKRAKWRVWTVVHYTKRRHVDTVRYVDVRFQNVMYDDPGDKCVAFTDFVANPSYVREWNPITLETECGGSSRTLRWYAPGGGVRAPRSAGTTCVRVAYKIRVAATWDQNGELPAACLTYGR